MIQAVVNPWREWLQLVEWDRMVIGPDRIVRWPESAAEFLGRQQLIEEAPAAGTLECPHCQDGEGRTVLRHNHPLTGAPIAKLLCPVCGPITIPLADLRRWRLSWSALVPVLIQGLQLRGQPQPIVTDRIWQLGKGYWSGRPTTLFLGRGMHRQDALQLLETVARFTNALILIPHRTPQTPLPHPVLTLDLVAEWHDGELEFDGEFLAVQSTTPRTDVGKLPTKSPPKKEGHRAAVRLRLKAELDAHVRACRGHVQSALDFGRSPTLLPFPSYDTLAERCGTSKATISRCLQDDAELRRMCQAARDLFQQFSEEDGKQ